MNRYNPKVIEPKWQKIWSETGLYKTDMSRAADKAYVIPMLPYPSGDLHIGHWYNFGPTDTVARFHRMLGQNVLTTNGFDAFGLPAENAAIKRGIQPAKWTHSNIADMTKQLERIGASYDWSHSLATCDPGYYRWNQWLFLQLYKKGLAYRAKAVVNWCPKDKTVLANEQVVGDDNVCERCGTPVIQKEMESWYFKITDYTERLLEDLEKVDWPNKVKVMQQNWIGKSQGAAISFGIKGSKEKIEVFTTRPDTIYGATFMVLAPEHKILNKLSISAEAKKYIEGTKRKTELERKEGEKNKTGVFSGAYAVNPATKKEIPIWVADYILADYGTGAIMAVPAHDERDNDFAIKFNLPIRSVIEPLYIQTAEPGALRPELPLKERQAITAIVKHWSEDKYLGLKWKKVDWDTFITGGVEAGQTPEQAAAAEIREETGYKNLRLIRELPKTHAQFFHVPKGENRFAHFSGFLFELNDGERQEMADQEKTIHDVVWLTPTEMEKFRLPDSHRYLWECVKNNTYQPYIGEGVMRSSGKYNGLDSAQAREKIVADLAKTGVGKEQTNYRLRDWLISRQRYWGTPIPIIYCPDCGAVPVPEKDLPVVLPEDVEFSPAGRNPLLDRPDFMDVKCPQCDKEAKRETDTMDTFVDSSWYFLRYIDNKNGQAIFDSQIINKWAPVDHYIGGIEHAILHLLYARFITKFLYDQKLVSFEEPFKKLTNQGIILGPDGHKMSKSRGNVVSPDEQVNSYGADSLRLYLMFMGPYELGGPYNLGGIAGTRRFIDRLWTLTTEFLEISKKSNADISEVELTAAVHRTVKKVTQDLETLSFNTAIAAMMALVNDLYKAKVEMGLRQSPAWRFAIETLVQLLAPFAPHVAEELWSELGHSESVHVSKWPLWDEKLIKEGMITIAVQINGKVRAEIDVAVDAPETAIIELAKKSARVAELLKEKKVRKEIYVPGRLVSLVVE